VIEIAFYLALPAIAVVGVIVWAVVGVYNWVRRGRDRG
jgi:hypothetical protein